MATGKGGLRQAWVGGAAGLLLGLGLAGCGTGADGTGAAPVPNVEPQQKATAALPGGTGAADARYAEPFEQAAITDDIPEGQQLPPDRTVAGKPTGPLRVAVEKLWPTITLTDQHGNPRTFTATVDTELGSFEIALKPEWAPNHVRNFIALALAGYYDGLFFDRVIHQESDRADSQKARIDLVKGGCPVGTGEGGLGHIGYFLKPEPPTNVTHAEGTVGVWRDAHPNSGACRFYITLGPAPTLDGDFALIGQVARGLDVVKRIAARPVLDPKTYPECERPVEPVVIKKMAVTPDPTGKPEPAGYNQR